jgi:ribose transport system permease protein
MLVLLCLFFTFLPATSETFPTLDNLRITLGSSGGTDRHRDGGPDPADLPGVRLLGRLDSGTVGGVRCLVPDDRGSLLVALGLSIAIGLAVGLVNGLLVTRLGVNSVISTFGMATLIAGVVALKTDGKSIVSGIPDGLTDFVSWHLARNPRGFYVALGVCAAAWYLLRQTPWGRYLDAIGDNREAARLLGANVRRRILTAYLITGAVAGGAALLLIGDTGTASPQVGPGLHPAGDRSRVPECGCDPARSVQRVGNARRDPVPWCPEQRTQPGGSQPVHQRLRATVARSSWASLSPACCGRNRQRA